MGDSRNFGEAYIRSASSAAIASHCASSFDCFACAEATGKRRSKSEAFGLCDKQAEMQNSGIYSTAFGAVKLIFRFFLRRSAPRLMLIFPEILCRNIFDKFFASLVFLAAEHSNEQCKPLAGQASSRCYHFLRRRRCRCRRLDQARLTCLLWGLSLGQK
eukprot:SAG31_NODE_5940_length_2247_cov_2.822626_3_plen_159_part_00